MSRERLLSAIRAQAQMAAQLRGSLRIGLITSYDPDTYSVKVKFPPDDVESGWIPLGAAAVGNGWGILAAPAIDDQVAVSMQDSDPDAGLVACRLFNNVDVPPSVPTGEIWMVHKTGSYLKFLTDGSVELVTNKDLTATVGGKLTAEVQGDADATVHGDMSATIDGDATMKAASWDVTGDCTWHGTITATVDVIANGISLHNHVHGGVTSGSSATGAPE